MFRKCVFGHWPIKTLSSTTSPNVVPSKKNTISRHGYNHAATMSEHGSNHVQEEKNEE
jgi:hypothetical protein